MQVGVRRRGRLGQGGEPANLPRFYFGCAAEHGKARASREQNAPEGTLRPSPPASPRALDLSSALQLS